MIARLIVCPRTWGCAQTQAAPRSVSVSAPARDRGCAESFAANRSTKKPSAPARVMRCNRHSPRPIRTGNNVVFVGDDGRTPAMRLGFAREMLRYEDILSLWLAMAARADAEAGPAQGAAGSRCPECLICGHLARRD